MSGGSSAPHDLRVEHLGDAVLGLGDRRPRLSWLLPDGAARQDRYVVELDGAAGEPVESSCSVLVPWPAASVESAQRVEWRVKVWTDRGESPWSEPAWFETGLLEPSAWSARWIEPVEPESSPPGHRPVHVLRTTFRLDRPSSPARMHSTAHGLYECFLNGRRVGDRELSPGFTGYQAHLHVQVTDVTDLLIDGDNEWDVVLSDGWYRGQTGTWHHADCYGTTVAFLGELHVGGHVVTATGDGWLSGHGPIVTADLMEGQVEDKRRRPGGWAPVRPAAPGAARLTFSPAPPTRRVEMLSPVSIRRISADRQIVDLGQNLNGWVRLANLGPEGTRLTLVHGEALDASGDVTLANVAASDSLCVAQTDVVTSAGVAGDVFEPRHTTHGFQYVRVVDHPDDLTPADVTGVSVRTDMRRTGWFSCSDERINRLHEIADWSFRGNSCEIPTDCPQRERNGWTGDWQVFHDSAAFLYDVAGFSVKWLRDLAAQQCPDGLVANLAPEPHGVDRCGDPTWRGLQGSSGWGDAAVIVPWQLACVYGDEAILAEMWPTMTAWVDYAARAASTLRHPTRVASRPVASPHEEFLWDGGWHWGEWCEPAVDGAEPWYAVDQGHVGTAYLHHSALLLARIAAVLERDAEAHRYTELADAALAAWRTEYVGSDGALTPDTQANHVRALAFGLVPEHLRRRTADRLVGLIREAGTHVGTGFLATPFLLPVLVDAGHVDVAYELLLQDTPPSWLTMVDRGATTVWEEWEGIDADGAAHASLNHYSKGAVISFLHRYVAGIRLPDGQPAYRHFRVQPVPGGGLTCAEATHDSRHGRIRSSWRVDDGTFHLDVTVPAGCTADVVLPSGDEHLQGCGTVSYVEPA